MKKTISILGSTGSIGCNTINLIRKHKKIFSLRAITANKNVDLLAKQAKEFSVELAVVADKELYKDLKSHLAGTNIRVAAGTKGLLEAASLGSDIVMSAIMGAAGLAPTVEAIKAGSNLALANKECLVCAGDLIIKLAKLHNVKIIPVDSEHSAIFQVFDSDRSHLIDKVILTASGGPFLKFSKKELENVTKIQALNHPNWDMGNKITIDCATMMNKGFEMIEAYHLFPIEQHQIDVVIHPESIIHSLVSYIDGSTLAQLGIPDMQVPISYALAWPERIETDVKGINLAKLKSINFQEMDEGKFPAIRIVKESMKRGKSSNIILNAVNEITVRAFLEDKIKFTDIIKTVESLLDKLPNHDVKNLNDIIEVDKISRQAAEEFILNKFHPVLV